MKQILLALLLGPQESPGMTAEEVLQWMTRETKLEFAHDRAIGLENRRIAVTPGALDPKRAYEVGLALLRSSGFAAVRKPEAGIVEIVPAPLAGKREAPVYTSAETLPKADEFCTLTIKVRHLSPRDLQAAFINLVSFPQHCLSSEASGTLILTDHASNLRRLAQLAKELDVPRPVEANRIGVAILEGSSGKDSLAATGFEGQDLEKATGKNRFVIKGEGFVRVSSTATPAVLRFPGSPVLVVEFMGRAGPEGASLLKFTVKKDAEPPLPPEQILQTQVDLKAGGWVLVGSVPSDKEGACLVVLARATAGD